MKTEIYDLSTTSLEPMAIYENDLDPVENLITQYIIDFYGPTQIHNENLRYKLMEQVVIGTRSTALASYSVVTGK